MDGVKIFCICVRSLSLAFCWRCARPIAWHTRTRARAIKPDVLHHFAVQFCFILKFYMRWTKNSDVFQSRRWRWLLTIIWRRVRELRNFSAAYYETMNSWDDRNFQSHAFYSKMKPNLIQVNALHLRKSNLSSLFGGNMVANESSSDSLTYTAPKQPKKQVG